MRIKEAAREVEQGLRAPARRVVSVGLLAESHDERAEHNGDDHEENEGEEAGAMVDAKVIVGTHEAPVLDERANASRDNRGQKSTREEGHGNRARQEGQVGYALCKTELVGGIGGCGRCDEAGARDEPRARPPHAMNASSLAVFKSIGRKSL